MPRQRTFSTYASRMLATACAAALLATTVAVDVAGAAPGDDLDSVERKVRSLGVTVGMYTEDYDEARIKLADTKRRLASINKRLDRQQTRVEELRGTVSTVAATAYMAGATDVATLTTSRTPQEAVDRATLLQHLSTEQRSKIQRYDREAKALAAQRRAAAGALDEQKALTATLGKKRAAILATLKEQKRLLDRLTADRAREAASRDGRQSGVDLPPASGRAADAIEFAKRQLGKPYEWGAEGPNSYDCSGLTMMAWRQGGVSLPHSSRMQYDAGPHVPRSQLEPGDLVFFGDPIHHVGLYVGNGQMIAAPSTGKTVTYADINNSYYRSEWTGAVRLG